MRRGTVSAKEPEGAQEEKVRSFESGGSQRKYRDTNEQQYLRTVVLLDSVKDFLDNLEVSERVRICALLERLEYLHPLFEKEYTRPIAGSELRELRVAAAVNGMSCSVLYSADENQKVVIVERIALR